MCQLGQQLGAAAGCRRRARSWWRPGRSARRPRAYSAQTASATGLVVGVDQQVLALAVAGQVDLAHALGRHAVEESERVEAVVDAR